MNKMPSREALQQDLKEGLSQKKIADNRNTSQQSVSKWMIYYGLSARAPTEPEAIRVGDATVVGYGFEDSGEGRYAVPGGGYVVGVDQARRVAGIMNSLVGGCHG